MSVNLIHTPASARRKNNSRPLSTINPNIIYTSNPLLKDKNDKNKNTTLKAIKNNNLIALSNSPNTVINQSLDDCSFSTRGSLSSSKNPISNTNVTPTYKRIRLTSTERTDQQLSSIKVKQQNSCSPMLEYHAFVDVHKGVLSTRKSSSTVQTSSNIISLPISE